MKSKSFHLQDPPNKEGKIKHNKTLDLVGVYKPASETDALLAENSKSVKKSAEENNKNNKSNLDTPKFDRSLNKKKKKNKNESIDVSHVGVDDQTSQTNFKNSLSKNSLVGATHVTSTPNASEKNTGQVVKVKSIMKNSSTIDDSMEASSADYSAYKPKKRNKSVSFMLDDTEEAVVNKKTKSDDSPLKLDKHKHKTKHCKDVKKLKKLKKNSQEEKENTASINVEDDGHRHMNGKKMKAKVNKSEDVPDTTPDAPMSDSPSQETTDKKKKIKKTKKEKPVEENSEPTENELNEEGTEPKAKKLKKKKRHTKSANNADSTETDGEPVSKSRKKEAKPDIIADDLENLSIGDNPHTLTNLLDEMTVVDKDKKKKNKLRRKKDKTPKTPSVSSSETADLEKIEEGKEKIKWKKRKWNKDKKGETDDELLQNTIIVDNLPLKLLFSYKKLLMDHFVKYGLIKKIGIAELYPTEEPKPVFTTTVTFYSDGAATQALEEDNTLLQGSRIRIKRPLPPTQTTLVVRSYADLTDQSLSSVFLSAGRIRNIRHLVKGRKSMSTAFIEFDGPEAVEKAIKMAEDAKIGGKKIHVSKFELRRSKKEKKAKTNAESENEGDSEDSND